MKPIDIQIPIQLEFRAMENPVTVTMPQPVMRYLDLYANREETHAGEVVYKQGDRNQVMPVCLLTRHISANGLRP